MLKWIRKVSAVTNLVFIPYIASNPGMSHLIIDDFASHKTKAVLNLLRGSRCIVSILPGGSTSKLQVLDVGVNKPFKDHMRSKWMQFMVNDNADNASVVTRSMIACWVVQSWSEIRASSIRRTFQRIGFY